MSALDITVSAFGDATVRIPRSEHIPGGTVTGVAGNGRTFTVTLGDVVEADGDRVTVTVDVVSSRAVPEQRHVAVFTRFGSKWALEMHMGEWEEGREVEVLLMSGETKVVTANGLLFASLSETLGCVRFTDPSPRPGGGGGRDRAPGGTDSQVKQWVEALMAWTGGLTDSHGVVSVPEPLTTEAAVDLVALLMKEGLRAGTCVVNE